MQAKTIKRTAYSLKAIDNAFEDVKYHQINARADSMKLGDYLITIPEKGAPKMIRVTTDPKRLMAYYNINLTDQEILKFKVEGYSVTALPNAQEVMGKSIDTSNSLLKQSERLEEQLRIKTTENKVLNERLQIESGETETLIGELKWEIELLQSKDNQSQELHQELLNAQQQTKEFKTKFLNAQQLLDSGQSGELEKIQQLEDDIKQLEFEKEEQKKAFEDKILAAKQSVHKEYIGKKDDVAKKQLRAKRWIMGLVSTVCVGLTVISSFMMFGTSNWYNIGLAGFFGVLFILMAIGNGMIQQTGSDQQKKWSMGLTIFLGIAEFIFHCISFAKGLELEHVAAKNALSVFLAAIITFTNIMSIYFRNK